MTDTRGVWLLAVALLWSAPPPAAAQAVTDRVTCRDSEGASVFEFLAQLWISGCQLHADCRLTWLNPHRVADAPEPDSLRAELLYGVDLSRDFELAAQPSRCADGSTQHLTLAPARLAAKRVVVVMDGASSDRNDVPIFGDDSTRLTLLLSSATAEAFAAAVSAARERCRAENQ